MIVAHDLTSRLRCLRSVPLLEMLKYLGLLLPTLRQYIIDHYLVLLEFIDKSANMFR